MRGVVRASASQPIPCFSFRYPVSGDIPSRRSAAHESIYMYRAPESIQYCPSATVSLSNRNTHSLREGRTYHDDVTHEGSERNHKYENDTFSADETATLEDFTKRTAI